MVEKDYKSILFVEKCLTSSSLDESLFLVERYINTQLTKIGKKALTMHDADIIVHLRVLEVDGTEKNIVKTNGSPKAIYSIWLSSSSIVFGPLYKHGQRPCPQCLRRRWLDLRLVDNEPDSNGLEKVLIFGHNPWLTSFALEAVWTTLKSLLSTRFVPPPNNNSDAWIYTLNLENLRLKQYQLIADPFCPICSSPTLDSAEAAVLHLVPRLKRDISDYRLIKASEYSLPIVGYINPVCGILGPSALFNHTHIINTPVVGKFLSKGKFAIHTMLWGGHGDTYSTSRSIGLLEGLERLVSLKAQAKQSVIFDSYENLQEHALDPLACGLYPAETYQAHDKRLVPFSSTLKMSWVWGYSFRSKRPILVPEQLSYYGDDQTDDYIFVRDTSNGCAIGGSLEEAILFGLLELIERDSFLITWYTKLALRKIDPFSCTNQENLHLLDRINRLGYDVHLFDTRFDIDVPSVLVVAVLRENGLGKLAVSPGASLDPEKAIHSALSEVGSTIGNFTLQGEKEWNRARVLMHDHTKVTLITDHSLLYGLPEMAATTEFLFQDRTITSLQETYAGWQEKYPQHNDLREDLNHCINEMLRREMDVIVVDLTSPDQERVGLKTVRVIAPGLLPIGFGWDKVRVGDLPRLRTAPRIAGYLEKDFNPTMMNRAPHPFA